MVLDAGDLLYKSTRLTDRTRQAAQVSADALVKELARSGAAALVPGERDFAAGVAAYVERMSKAKLPVLAANLLDKATGKAPFPGHRLVTIGGMRVGFAGVVAAAPFKAVDTVQVHPPAGEAAAAARKALESEGAELFVLIAHANARKLEELLGPKPPWDIIVTGHDRRGSSRPDRLGDAIVVSGGDRGRQVGHLTLFLDGGAPWGRLTDAGEAGVLEKELGLMADRRKYYEKMAVREGLRNRSKTFYASRITELDEEKLKLEAKLRAAKTTPKAGSSFKFAMAPMNAQIAEDPACAKALAPALRALAVLQPKGGHQGHGHQGGLGGPLSDQPAPPFGPGRSGSAFGTGGPSGGSKGPTSTSTRPPAPTTP